MADENGALDIELSKEQILEIVQSREWDVQGFNAYPLYLLCAATESGWVVKDQFGVGYTHFFYLFSNDRAQMYYDRNDLQNVCDGYYKMIHSLDELECLISKHQSSYRALVEATTYDEDATQRSSTLELVALFAALCRRLASAVKYAHVIEGITYGSERMLRELLSAKGSFSEEEFGLICSPVHSSFLSEAQEELRRIKPLMGDEQSRAIDAFIADYGWIENTYLGGKQFSHADIARRIENLKGDADTADYRENSSRKAAITGRFNLSDKERLVISTIESCFHWQDERKKYILQSISALDPVVAEVARRTGIEAADLKFANPDEISEAQLLDEEFRFGLKKRREKSCCYSVPGRNYVFTGADYDFFAQHLHVEPNGSTKELKGLVASPGIVHGIVRVCESVSDIDKIRTGEVLVASMTRPEYLPAMQRAIAFVTDEGGITSHAAIVAREMKKPCIIGTKIATQVLKDGDMVEVDATHGNVRVL